MYLMRSLVSWWGWSLLLVRQILRGITWSGLRRYCLFPPPLVPLFLLSQLPDPRGQHSPENYSITHSHGPRRRTLRPKRSQISDPRVPRCGQAARDGAREDHLSHGPTWGGQY